MGKGLSPLLQRELKNLDKDSASRKSAMKALKSYVQDLDSSAIPYFLAQVSERKESSSSGEHTVSLYEVLARVHGAKIVPNIGNIMSTIIKTLSSSAGSFALHQACAKVVPAIARYGIEPMTPEDRKRCIIGSLCKPLSDCLLGRQESLSSGAALCLKALVDCDNWRYASTEIVNEICQRVVGALEEQMESNSHMALVMALAKHNSFIVEAYARLLIRTGIHILNTGVAEGNPQKSLIAIHMLNTLMKCLDQRSILSEVDFIIEEIEKFQTDQMAYVSGAAFEALQTARKIHIEKSPKFENDTSSLTGSNYIHGGEDSMRGNVLISGRRSSLTASSESQNIDSLVDSSVHHRSVNRKLWVTPENCAVDEAIHAIANVDNEIDECSSEYRDKDDFSGFSLGAATNENSRTTTPSSQRSNINVKIFTPPRTHRHPLQKLDDVMSENCERKNTRHRRTPSSRTSERTPALEHEGRCYCNHLNRKMDDDDDKSHDIDEKFHTRSASISSTENVSDNVDEQAISESEHGSITEPQSISLKGGRRRSAGIKLVYGFFMILSAVCAFLLCIDDEASHYLVPT